MFAAPLPGGGGNHVTAVRVKIGFAKTWKNKLAKVSDFQKSPSDTVDDACVLDCFSGSMIRANNTQKMEHSCYICTAVLK